MSIKKQLKIVYIHTDGWAGRFACPCIIVSCGPKYAKVKLLEDFRVGNKWYNKGSVKTRVPISSLSEKPNNATIVGKDKK